ncbi:NO-inducible flavohemoprotein [Paenibacillus sp. N1-5-1-14]|uniref:NO-inducible flavohemoprotein n=1 Tax=Paenibacillus radicibacter TaxID=2972488 RepID=UPI0021598DB6|nr:NO-inducible flavohemoprotein [Paenibacillus radicibacter]MCR8644803.1 NO-inducible flavohemoprotein [Paenibacillus radicibacter]
MLDQYTRNIIKSTVPVLEMYGNEITKTFYKRLFEKHPELLNIFNQAHQKAGDQPKALANTVYAAAVHIDQLEAIIPVVKQIAHKHVSLGIKAEHYPIVGENLLAAIKEVLGDAATPEIIEAWGKAYGVIADIFIQTEANMYNESLQKEGGWSDFRPFVIDRKVRESASVYAFYLKPQDGGAIAKFLPGQYVSIKINDGHYDHIRQYSLTCCPCDGHYRIGVKHERGGNHADGVVSTYLHKQADVGDVLLLTPPQGEFVLDKESKRPALLLGAGIGITPLLSMIRPLAKKSRTVSIVHAVLNGEQHPFAAEIHDYAQKTPDARAITLYEQPTSEDRDAQNYDYEGRITLEILESALPATDIEAYICGPVPFMEQACTMLKELGVPADQIHYEVFGSAQAFGNLR